MKVDVLVEIYQGVLEGVSVLSHEEAKVVWQQWADKHGYKDYEEFLEAVEIGCEHELRWFEDIEFKRPKAKETAHNIIDLVETAIRKEHRDIDKIASRLQGNTLLHGEAYYNLENEVVEKIE